MKLINRLCQNNQTVIRIKGLSGVGKTRLVLEAMKTNYLKNLVVYFRTGREFLKNKEFIQCIKSKETNNLIIIVDECSLEDHNDIHTIISKGPKRLFLISISRDIDLSTSLTKEFLLTPLSNDWIIQIISEYFPKMPIKLYSVIANYSLGFPRVALIIAKSYKNEEDFSTQIPSKEILTKRLIAGEKFQDTEIYNINFKVLMGLSLFHMVGFKKSLSKEAKWLSKLIGVKWKNFVKIIKKQKERGMVQGDDYIFITVMPLVTYFFNEWFDKYWNKKIENFINIIPEEFSQSLLWQFLSRTQYLNSSQKGRAFIERIFSPDWLFPNINVLEDPRLGKQFLRLTKVSPKHSLKCLKHLFSKADEEEINKINKGQGYIIESLFFIAQWKNYFYDSVKLLLKIAEIENDFCISASDVLADLFSILPSYTEISPQERFYIFKEIVFSKIRKKNYITVKIINKLFEPIEGNIPRFDFHFKISKQNPSIWSFESHKDLSETYRTYWEFLANNISYFDKEITKDVYNVLIQSIKVLLKCYPERDFSLLDYLRGYPFNLLTDKRNLTREIRNLLDKNRVPLFLRDMFKDFYKENTELDFSQRLWRYVGENISFDEYVKGRPNKNVQAEAKLIEIAKEALKTPKLLEGEYSWLLTKKAKRGVTFGRIIGKIDHKNLFLDNLINKHIENRNNDSLNFLYGYFESLYKRDLDLWKNKIKNIFKNKQNHNLACKLTLSSKLDKQIAKNILLKFKNKELDICYINIFFDSIFILNCNDEIFSQWIKTVVEQNQPLLTVRSLVLFGRYYTNPNIKIKMPKNVGKSLLLNKTFLKNSTNLDLKNYEYIWTKTSRVYISQYPDSMHDFATEIISNFNSLRGICASMNSPFYDVLRDILKRSPFLMWNVVKDYFNISKNIPDNLKIWLRGDDILYEDRNKKTIFFGAINYFNPKDIWKWIDENPIKRTLFIVPIIPRKLPSSFEDSNLAKEFLIRYGESPEIRNALSKNYLKLFFNKNTRAICKELKEYFYNLGQRESNLNIKKFIDETIIMVEEYIKKYTKESKISKI